MLNTGNLAGCQLNLSVSNGHLADMGPIRRPGPPKNSFSYNRHQSACHGATKLKAKRPLSARKRTFS